jgi:hypothetical protein
MSDLADVVVALAARIGTGMGTDPLSGRTFAFALDSPLTPFAVALPGPNPVDYDTTMDGADDFFLLLKVAVGAEISRSAQTQLLGYMDRSGSTSIRAAVYGDKTLGGTVSDLKVTGWQNYGDVEWAGVVYFGSEMLVTAYT